MTKLTEAIFGHWIQMGREEMLSKCIEKFEELHEQYYSQGDYQAADLTVEMVAYLQDDLEALND